MKKYSIGLDIGTTSVGWAVVDKETDKVVRKRRNYLDSNGEIKKKTISLWGSRLFEEAKTAQDRRLKRGQRRRYARRRARIKLLRSLFEDEINKVDPDFFNKLDESFYKESDKTNKKHPLTDNDKKILKEYQKKYKTIYHLRNELVKSKEKKDIRLVYLAIHHIIKYRGNFNYSGLAKNFDVEKIDTFNTLKKLLIEFTDNLSDLNIDYNDDEFIKELNISLNEKVKGDRKKKIIKVLTNNNTPREFSTEFANALAGYKFNLTKLFNLDSDDIKMNFDDANFEDEIDKQMGILGDKTDLLFDLKSLYDMISLKSIFGKYENINSISDLKLAIYKEHGKDLRELKKIFKSKRESFNKLFFSENCTYFKYVRNKIEYSDLKKDLENEYKKLSAEKQERFDKLRNKLENGNLLPRVTSTENGRFPYQLNEVELIKIIENQKEYYPFLGEKTEDDKYNIVKILEFKIPYYVGPLNNTTNDSEKNNDNAWLIRNKGYENTPINPFNFDKIVNKDETAEKFIKKMISHCTYLLAEEALPNNSILYCKFKVLNELKQIKYNDGVKPEYFDNDTINKIFKELFLKEKNVTKKKFENYIRSNNIIQGDINYDLEGYSSDKGFANNMASYIDFLGKDGIFNYTLYGEEDAEKIIEWVTIFEDKDILKRKVKEEFKELNNSEVDRIAKLNYKGWGRLSRKLLDGITTPSDSSNPNKTIIELMRETEDNFMQILNREDYKFLETIEKINDKSMADSFGYSLVEDLATSPANKRGIWQALKIVREIVDYLGEDKLDSIYLEMARGEEEKKRSTRRKNKLEDFLNKNRDLFNNYEKLSKELKELDEKEINQRIYLYFMQGGKSLYSQTPININDIANKDLYEVDHIVPQSLIKDDSLENKALVLRSENQLKSGAMVLPEKFRNTNNIIWWNKLKKGGMLSPKKYKSLTRSRMDDKTLAGFINRQLVETRQISLHVANILRNIYGKNKNISFINANISHNYRECFELFKYRDLNDYHHAKDAYLAAVLGKFKDKIIDKRKVAIVDIREKVAEMRENKEYKKLKYGYIINSLNGSFTVANKDNGDVIEVDKLNKTIKHQMYNNDVLVTKKTEIRTGKTFKETKVGAKEKIKKINIKKNLPISEYGGYIEIKFSYLDLIYYEKKNKKYQQLIGIPVIYANSGGNKKIDYLKKHLGLKDTDSIKILKERIPFNSTLNIDGKICSVIGGTDNTEVCNAIEFKIDSKLEENWRYSLRKLFYTKDDDDMEKYDSKYNDDLNEMTEYIYHKIKKNYKLYSNSLQNIYRKLKLNEISSISTKEKQENLRKILTLVKFGSNRIIRPAYKISHAIIINKSVTGIKESYYEF